MESAEKKEGCVLVWIWVPTSAATSRLCTFFFIQRPRAYSATLYVNLIHENFNRANNQSVNQSKTYHRRSKKNKSG